MSENENGRTDRQWTDGQTLDPLVSYKLTGEQKAHSGELMRSCTRLVHECPKIHENHTAISARPYGSRKGAVRYPCDFYAQLRRQHDDRMISARSVYSFAQACCRNLSKKSHNGCIKM